MYHASLSIKKKKLINMVFENPQWIFLSIFSWRFSRCKFQSCSSNGSLIFNYLNACMGVCYCPCITNMHICDGTTEEGKVHTGFGTTYPAI